MPPSPPPPRYRRVFHHNFINSTSENQPRILELITENNKERQGDEIINDHKMCDHIATFLVAFDKQNPHEAVLKHFFDCNVGSFRIVAHAARPESGLESPNFVIWRDGNLVYCGQFELFDANEKIVRWFWFTRSEMTTVDIHSTWRTVFGARETWSEMPLRNILKKREERYGLYDTNESTPEYGPYMSTEIKFVSQKFGNLLSDQDTWVPESYKEFLIDTLIRKSATLHMNKPCYWLDPRGDFRTIRGIM